MLVTATTAKDTLPNLQKFVTRNLAGGVDHLVVFLDAEAPREQEWLEAHPHVTCVRTDDGWWQGDRPEQLNVRQRINANVVRALWLLLDPGGWVFHVDADEVVQVDRRELDALGADVEVLRLLPLEAVSRERWEGEVTHFKRLLGKEDLTLLSTLGVISRPTNGAHFHGHVDGKCGMRPAVDRWHTLHHVVDADGQELPALSPGWARVLHYESFSGEDFVRKWTAILEAGPMANFRPGREPTAVALRALIGKGLTPEQARPYLMRIFERTTQDDFDTLRDLGLLAEVDPDAGTHEPEPLGEDRRARLDALIASVATEAKRPFHPGRPAAAVVETMRRVADADVGAGARPSRLPWRR